MSGPTTRKMRQGWRQQIRIAGDCWIWTGGTHKGYGRFAGEQAHRTVYRSEIGQVPDGLELDHTCKIPLCVNPGHLEPVTRAENMRRRSLAQTHCGKGHEFTPANTYRDKTGSRHCRECGRNASTRYKQRRRGCALVAEGGA